MDTEKPVALVTGASSGIGKATAQALVEAGYQVVGTSRKTAGLARRRGVTMLDLDVASDESTQAAVDQVLERFGRIDVLVNNAGIGSTGAAEELSVEQDQHVFEVNVVGVMRMTKAVLPHMRAQGSGRIINLSSVLGFVPQPYMATYVASKHAVEGYSESVDHEVREHGVRVILVQPASTNTPFDASAVQPEVRLAAYEERMGTFNSVMEEMMRAGDQPGFVAAVIVQAATAKKPKLRYAVGQTASRASLLRRIAPRGAFDKQIRKLNRMVG
jgi:NAD(P)-dependent dehydrogenase (short-subunit alcohol dehydrogenase family)